MGTPREKAKAGSAHRFDLDQARAIRRDREGTRFEFTFAGEAYSCLPIREWPLSTSGLLAEGKMTEALRDILGPDYDRFEEAGATLADVEALVEALGEFSGVGDSLGE